MNEEILVRTTRKQRLNPPTKLLGTRRKKANVKMIPVVTGVLQQRAASGIEEAVEPRAILADRDRVVVEDLLHPAVEEDDLGVRLGRERPHQRPVRRQIHRVLARALHRQWVHACAVIEAEIRVAARLMAVVRPQVAAFLLADVVHPQRSDVRKLLLNRARHDAQVHDGLAGAPGDAWSVVSPENAWGTRETVVFLSVVARAVMEQFPYVAPLRVNHIGKQEGGYLRPHHSHQSGRDADLGFYYRAGMNPLLVKGARENAMDLPANWALVRALATRTDTQVILLDRRVQKVLYDYAVSIGEDRAWLDSLFNAGRSSLLQHVRRHRDHFHVRFYSARSQELGWRIQPLLAKRSDENFVIHRVRPGDTLGHLAMRYGSGVKLIQRANGLTSINLRLGRTLNIPLRGPCTKCPLPPQVVVPPRRFPASRSRGDAGIL